VLKVLLKTTVRSSHTTSVKRNVFDKCVSIIFYVLIFFMCIHLKQAYTVSLCTFYSQNYVSMQHFYAIFQNSPKICGWKPNYWI